MYILGFDIGGTKCAVITARWDGDTVTIEQKSVCETDKSVPPTEIINRLISMADTILTSSPDTIGISCGGPLDSEQGLILSPPNLPGWDNVEIVKQIQAHYSKPTYLQNDANACALAEWKFGAGRGTKNMVFFTFGTGLGAGLILDGRLYSGTNDNAGEAGHILLDRFGPVGFGKSGSFEGFCSGGGIAQLGYLKALEKIQSGEYPMYFKKGMTRDDITAKSIAEAARLGDSTAMEVYRISGKYLGRGLSIVIDLLNPEMIVIGGVFTRSRDLLWDTAKKEIEKEALLSAWACCRVAPAGLGEEIGDYGAVATALLGEKNG